MSLSEGQGECREAGSTDFSVRKNTGDRVLSWAQKIGSWPLLRQLSYFIGILYNKTVSEGQLAQLVRASRLHREGQRFESSIAHRHGFARVDFSDIVDFVVSGEAGVAQW